MAPRVADFRARVCVRVCIGFRAHARARRRKPSRCMRGRGVHALLPGNGDVFTLARGWVWVFLVLL